MTSLLATAPGKIVLSGEYAVLAGAPAIAMAVDRRARVTVTDAPGDVHAVRAPGFDDAEVRFRAGTGYFEWLGPAESYRLFETVVSAVDGNFDGGKVFSLDTRAFYSTRSRDKLGLGGSAALATSLAAVLHASTSAMEDVFAVALRAHRLHQRGAGSGIDIACSVHGGLLAYDMETSRATPLRWPAALEFAVFFTGASASTTGLLDILSDARHSRSWHDLADAAARAATAWRSEPVDTILREVRRFTTTLRRFSSDQGVGIFDAGHAEMTDAADELGIVYKPCGAGGGDVGIALATDRSRLLAFTDRATAAGFQLLDVALDPVGVTLDRLASADQIRQVTT